MTVDEIKELIQLVHESGIAELEVQRGENRVRIRRTIAAANQEITVSQALPAMIVPQSSPTLLSATPVTSEPIQPSPANHLFVKSPIVGTFYEAPSPGLAPFVKVGDRVSTGQVLCIIESMKLMNEIEAEISGVLVSKLVENGQPVEYGEALFAVQPA